MKSFLLALAVLSFTLQSTANMITSTPTGGDWMATTTWLGGALPTFGDSVTIVAGSTVTIAGDFYVSIPYTGIAGTLVLVNDPNNDHFPDFRYPGVIDVLNGGVLQDNSSFNYGDGVTPILAGAIGITGGDTIYIRAGGMFVPQADSTNIYDADVSDPNQQHLKIETTVNGPYTIYNDFNDGNTIKGVGGILPVSLYNFSGRYQPSGVLLSWNTASEQNNAYFELQRSIDGKVFMPIATVQGSGTSSMPHSYQYTDANIFKLAVGVLYYRLKQVDIDGKVTYYGIVRVSLKEVAAILKLWPNPNNGQFMLQLDKMPEQSVIMHIYNDQGQLVSQGKFRQQQVSIDLSGKSKGVYYIQLVYPDGSKDVLNAVVQ